MNADVTMNEPLLDRQPPTQRSMRYPGLDSLRVIAMAIVTLQHGIVAVSSIEGTRIWQTSLGQYGISLFCAISGLLAFQDHRPAGQWLRRRLVRLYPAYWITVLVGFAANALLRYKPANWELFLLQMAGLNYFARASLVNVATWFFSLILLCYAIGFFVKLSARPRLALSVCACGLVCLALKTVGTSVLSAHILSFCLCGLVGMCAPLIQRKIFAVLGLLIIPLIYLARDMAYVAFSLQLMALSLGFTRAPRPIPNLAKSTYEYYLIHGMCFAAAGRYLHGSWMLLSVGIGLAFLAACAGAVVLKSITDRVDEALRRYDRPHQRPPDLMESFRRSASP